MHVDFKSHMITYFKQNIELSLSAVVVLLYLSIKKDTDQDKQKWYISLSVSVVKDLVLFGGIMYVILSYLLRHIRCSDTEIKFAQFMRDVYNNNTLLSNSCPPRVQALYTLLTQFTTCAVLFKGIQLMDRIRLLILMPGGILNISKHAHIIDLLFFFIYAVIISIMMLFIKNILSYNVYLIFALFTFVICFVDRIMYALKKYKQISEKMFHVYHEQFLVPMSYLFAFTVKKEKKYTYNISVSVHTVILVQLFCFLTIFHIILYKDTHK
jgi:hypothetical protein